MGKRLKSIKKSTWIKFGLGVFLLMAFVLSFQFVTIHRFISVVDMIHWVEAARSNPHHLVIFYGTFLLAILALPITIFPIIGGVLCPFWLALPLNMMMTLAGAWLAFGLARLCGREAIAPFLKGRIKLIDRLTAHEGFKTVFLIRLIGIPPFTVANYALGLSGIKAKDFVVGTLIGLAPWMTVVTYASHSLWEAVVMGGQKGLAQALWSALTPLMILSFLVLASVTLTFYLKRRKNRVLGSLKSGGSEKEAPSCL